MVPFIRASKGNAAQQIATKLDSKLRDRFLNSKNDFAKDSTEKRPSKMHYYF